MHLHFIYPRWPKLLDAQPSLRASLSAHEVGSLRMTSLGIPSAAGALPSDVTVSLTDDHVDDATLPLASDQPTPDAICLGYFTPQATRAHAIADCWRARGFPVICGGIHPSAIPEDAEAHADAVVCGPVEGLWETILADLAAGSLRQRYVGNPQAPFASPRRDLFDGASKLRIDVLQSARGCDRRCAFCVVPTVNGSCIVRKDPTAAVDDCAACQHPAVFLADENLLHDDPSDRTWATAFHRGLRERRIRRFFTAAAYPRTVIALAGARAAAWQQAGLRQIYLISGYMAALDRELNDPRLQPAIVTLAAMGIEVLITFTLGHDDDAVAVDDLCLDFWRATGANLAEVTISVPFPGTKRFALMEAEGRLLHRHWEHYNGAWCVFQPRHGSPQDVEDCSLRLWQALYAEHSRYHVQKAYIKGFGQDVLRGDLT